MNIARPALICALLGSAAVAGTPARADNAAEADPHAQHRAMLEQPSRPAGNAEGIVLPDVTLLTQHATPVNFKRDVVGDHIVVIDFVYTTCTTICPVLSAILGQVQERLGERLGGEVVMASVTVDPMRDTPARLKSYAAKHGARDGWLWLTGERETVKAVLTEFGVFTPNFEDHPSMVLIGDGRTDRWTRLLGFPSAEQIVKHVDQYGAARAAHGGHATMDHAATGHAAMGHGTAHGAH